MFQKPILFLTILIIPFTVFAQDITPGIVHLENGDLESAQSYFSNILKSDSKNPEANFYMGRVYFEREDFKEATDWFKTAADNDEGNSTYHMWLGHGYGRQAQNASVLKQAGLARRCRNNYEKSIELDPSNIEARESIMDYYMQAPRFMGGGRDKAEAEADSISELDPIAGIVAWGNIYTYYDEIENAMRHYTSAMELYPEAMSPYNSLYTYFFNSGDYGSAKEIVQKQLSVNDTSAYIHVNYGNALQWNGEYDAAIGQYYKAIEIDSVAYNAWYQMGRLAAVSGTHLEEGLEWIQKFIDLDDELNNATQAWAHFRKGTIYEHLNNESGAIEEYELTLQKFPDHPEAKQAIERLR